LKTIRHVNQLLALNDLLLVEALFASLLQRKADPEELEFYVGQLRAGYGKAEMLGDFVAMPEAIAGCATIAGLQEYAMMQAKRRNSLWRSARPARPRERQLNRLENSVGQLLQEIAGLKREARQRLEAMERGLSRLPADGSDESTGTEGQRGSAVNSADSVDLSGESATVRRIFRELLKQADSAKRQEPE
jgi:hypothetical protein